MGGIDGDRLMAMMMQVERSLRPRVGLLSMFLLGHMVMGYLLAKPVSKLVRENTSTYLLLLAGVIPDFDVLFPSLIRHHTITHSIVYWIPVLLALGIIFRKRAVPIAIGIVQHFLVGDFLVGASPLLLPLSDIKVGLSLGMPSAADTIIELSVLVAVFAYAWANGDARNVIAGRRENILMIIPLVAMVGLSAFVTGETELVPLVTYGFSRRALSAITIGHIVLGAAMLIAVIQGLKQPRLNLTR